MKKTVAVIGTGERMSAAIAFGLAKAGYRTLVTSYDQSDLTPLVGKLPRLVGKIRFKVPQADVEIHFLPRDASWEADIIIPAIPYQSQAAVASDIRDVVTGKIVISVINPLNDSLDHLLTPLMTSAAEELATLLPHSKVVKAFNTVSALDFETRNVNGQQSIDVFVAGDDDESVFTVSQLIKDVGFNPLIAGKLSMSRTLEGMMLLLANLSVRYNHSSLARWKVVHDAALPPDKIGM